MDVISLLREQAKSAHGWFDATAADITNEQAHSIPPGTAHPLGSRYAHLVVAEDAQINKILQGRTPLFASAWAGKTGISEPEMFSSLEWARRVKVDMPAVREYAQAVFANTDQYIASLKSEDLDRVIDMFSVGLGHLPLSMFLSDLVIGHVHDVAGEIAAVKGVQGLKGWPL